LNGVTNVNNALKESGAFHLSSTKQLESAATLGSTLTVTGATTMNNGATVNGTSALNGALTVAGGAALNSSLAVTGATTLSSTLGVTSDSSLGGQLNVAGVSNLNGGLAVTGPATVSSTLGVSGTATAGSLVVNNTSQLKGGATITGNASVSGSNTVGSLICNGAASLNNGVAVNGSGNITTTLGVGGLATVGALSTTGAANVGSLVASGAASVGTTLGVTGTATVGALSSSGAANVASVTTTSSVTVGTLLNVTTNITAGGTIRGNIVNTTGSASVGSTLGVGGLATVGALTTAGVANVGALSATGAAAVGTTLGVTGATTLNNTLGVTGATTLGNTLAVSGVTTLNNSVVVNPGTIFTPTSYFYGEYIQISLSSASAITSYSVGVPSTDASYEPAMFALLGSNDGIVWTVIDNPTSNDIYVSNICTRTVTANFSMYRLVITKILDLVTYNMYIGYFGLFNNGVNLFNTYTYISPTSIKNGNLTAVFSDSITGNPNITDYTSTPIYILVNSTLLTSYYFWPGTGTAPQIAAMKALYPSGVAGTSASKSVLTGTTSASGTFTVNSVSAAVNAPLTVSGASSFANTLGVTGATTMSSTLAVGDNANFQKDVTINGNLTVLGGQTSVNTTVMQVKDNAILIADNNTADILQSGLEIQYQPSGASAPLYAGLKRIPVTGQFAVFTGASSKISETGPTTSTDIYADMLANSFTCASDANLKKNIVSLDGVLDKLDGMRGVYHDWIDENQSKDRQIGVIAQEVQAVYPELVQVGANGYLSVNYPKLSAVLLQGMKEMNSAMKKMNDDMEALKALIAKQ
jgi:hypothetical protein